MGRSLSSSTNEMQEIKKKKKRLNWQSLTVRGALRKAARDMLIYRLCLIRNKAKVKIAQALLMQ